MQLFGRDVPCGCEDRKHIMFEQGNWTWGLVAVLTVPLLIYAIGRVTQGP